MSPFVGFQEHVKVQVGVCPFCGNGRLEVIPVDGINNSKMQVTCCECGARGPIGKTSREASEKWNNLGFPKEDSPCF